MYMKFRSRYLSIKLENAETEKGRRRRSSEIGNPARKVTLHELTTQETGRSVELLATVHTRVAPTNSLGKTSKSDVTAKFRAPRSRSHVSERKERETAEVLYPRSRARALKRNIAKRGATPIGKRNEGDHG